MSAHWPIYSSHFLKFQFWSCFTSLRFILLGWTCGCEDSFLKLLLLWSFLNSFRFEVLKWHYLMMRVLIFRSIDSCRIVATLVCFLTTEDRYYCLWKGGQLGWLRWDPGSSLLLTISSLAYFCFDFFGFELDICSTHGSFEVALLNLFPSSWWYFEAMMTAELLSDILLLQSSFKRAMGWMGLVGFLPLCSSFWQQHLVAYIDQRWRITLLWTLGRRGKQPLLLLFSPQLWILVQDGRQTIAFAFEACLRMMG